MIRKQKDKSKYKPIAICYKNQPQVQSQRDTRRDIRHKFRSSSHTSHKGMFIRLPKYIVYTIDYRIQLNKQRTIS